MGSYLLFLIFSSSSRDGWGYQATSMDGYYDQVDESFRFLFHLFTFFHETGIIEPSYGLWSVIRRRRGQGDVFVFLSFVYGNRVHVPRSMAAMTGTGQYSQRVGLYDQTITRSWGKGMFLYIRSIVPRMYAHS